jgi:hypothetical protein
MGPKLRSPAGLRTTHPNTRHVNYSKATTAIGTVPTRGAGWKYPIAMSTRSTDAAIS